MFRVDALDGKADPCGLARCRVQSKADEPPASMVLCYIHAATPAVDGTGCARLEFAIVGDVLLTARAAGAHDLVEVLAPDRLRNDRLAHHTECALRDEGGDPCIRRRKHHPAIPDPRRVGHRRFHHERVGDGAERLARFELRVDRLVHAVSKHDDQLVGRQTHLGDSAIAPLDEEVGTVGRAVAAHHHRRCEYDEQALICVHVQRGFHLQLGRGDTGVRVKVFQVLAIFHHIRDV